MTDGLVMNGAGHADPAATQVLVPMTAEPPPEVADQAAHYRPPAGLEARAVSAWFGSHKVLDRVSLDDASRWGDRADRSVRLWQVDVPADHEPHA